MGLTPGAAFFDAIAQDPVLSRVKLIAEPWDIGDFGFQLGNFPPGWAEWNGQFRDDLRSFWKGDEGFLPGLASSMLGSAGLFDKQGRRPWSSVNFVTAHDGFTLADLTPTTTSTMRPMARRTATGTTTIEAGIAASRGRRDDPEILACARECAAG